ncbi:hypothetical protein DICVIV_08219 [Dictyocaulus viviparus]|uniref:Uncharacterized protein n=1 Tax=Dictyocaulus viviparus TaxID=29172 RepID=A0A0D8XPN6_DICVI|nr:hypothetical protein DICVIV_08219 [Dictyocaulus viviparus]
MGQFRHLCTSDAIPTYGPVSKGRLQHWKEPLYSGPHLNPLEVGPDFSFIDGRTVQVTSTIQLNYKLDQIRLAKKIVELLNHINSIEDLHKKVESQREADAKHIDSLRPKSKGVESIV